MNSLSDLVLIPLLGLGGYLLAKRWPALARRGCEALLIVSATGLVALAISGVLHGIDVVGPFHRWLGHGTFIFNGLSSLVICGVLVQMRHGRQSTRLTLGIALLVLLVAATWLAGVTGYLEPSGEGLVAEETHNRFIVLHFFFFPACMAAVLAGMWWVIRRDRPSAQVTRAPDHPAEKSQSV